MQLLGFRRRTAGCLLLAGVLGSATGCGGGTTPTSAGKNVTRTTIGPATASTAAAGDRVIDPCSLLTDEEYKAAILAGFPNSADHAIAVSHESLPNPRSDEAGSSATVCKYQWRATAGGSQGKFGLRLVPPSDVDIAIKIGTHTVEGVGSEAVGDGSDGIMVRKNGIAVDGNGDEPKRETTIAIMRIVSGRM